MFVLFEMATRRRHLAAVDGGGELEALTGERCIRPCAAGGPFDGPEAPSTWAGLSHDEDSTCFFRERSYLRLEASRMYVVVGNSRCRQLFTSFLLFNKSPPCAGLEDLDVSSATLYSRFYCLILCLSSLLRLSFHGLSY